MKSNKAREILQSGACHVCDGELMDGHRVGCDDLAYYVTAEEAIEQAEADRDAKAVEAHRRCCFFRNDNGECANTAVKCGENSCFYMNNFIKKLKEE